MEFLVLDLYERQVNNLVIYLVYYVTSHAALPIPRLATILFDFVEQIDLRV